MKYSLSTPTLDDCYILTPKVVIGVHHPVIHTNTFSTPKPHGRTINYELEDPSDKGSGTIVTIDGNEPQRIDMTPISLHLGIRYMFVCECGRNCAKMFLPPNGNRFMCRFCTDLPYMTWLFKDYGPNTLRGKLKKLKNMERLAASRENITPIIYGGKFTKKFERMLRVAEKAGLTSFVQDAKDLKESLEALD